jgi:hypothetical protein
MSIIKFKTEEQKDLALRIAQMDLKTYKDLFFNPSSEQMETRDRILRQLDLSTDQLEDFHDTIVKWREVYANALYDAKRRRDVEAAPVPAAVTKSNRTSVVVYPFWAWEGTPYHDFAKACAQRNNIPLRFFVEGLKTVVGAICGHRIRLQDNQMDARFYTVLLSDVGGVGKSTVAEWIQLLFEDTNLVYRNGMSDSSIGCHWGGFGSGVGMIKRMAESPRVLQYYDEIIGMIEKFGITGSGQGFLGTVNTLYDSNLLPSNDTKETNLRLPIPKKVWNSILGLSILEKWYEGFSNTSAENSGLFQRLNLVYAEKIKIVGRLHEPNLSSVRASLLKKINPLKDDIIYLKVEKEADTIFDAWFAEFLDKTREHPSDVTGRINVLVWRNAMQIAWLLTDLSVAPRNDGGFGEMGYEGCVTADVMRRAIALGEYAWRTRLACRPVSGKNDTSRLEASISDRLKKESPIGRSDMYSMVNGSRVGLETFQRALMSLKAEGYIFIEEEVAQSGKAPGGRKKQLLHWVGKE